MQGQKKWHSWTEQVLNVGSGLAISYLTWVLIVAPIWGFDLPVHEIFTINILFTLVSIFRGYLWRRAFNWIHVKGISSS